MLLTVPEDLHGVCGLEARLVSVEMDGEKESSGDSAKRGAEGDDH